MLKECGRLMPFPYYKLLDAHHFYKMGIKSFVVACRH